jgi:hypothetical protein
LLSFSPLLMLSWHYPWMLWIYTLALHQRSLLLRHCRNRRSSSWHWKWWLVTYFFRRSRSHLPWPDVPYKSNLNHMCLETPPTTCGQRYSHTPFHFPPNLSPLHQDHSTTDQLLGPHQGHLLVLESILSVQNWSYTYLCLHACT